ncbi:KPN_02809 family neutral zinc metallopeptidase [Cellulomonas chengniuliangii]|uniref:Neutral zinc metallopeptidase n=1 Tax=Cellulomonas chengniuliangii TaxID=2968084 RepID=A0ABY5KUB1_9CELL|nr:neutral zinc metallopeptidase [Cellulomonas chengniuliangii]MCC2308696.1 neutral zinc metallopeptidase [Cellulomonas chengniuliangii]MCC2317714.1 neutral zinc metallopeptidase [Cellulomonas chengniuliangii]UUI74052.1 neutral zinc metallopeptidase [Cellulomonas chengniuliangii]
MTFTEGGSFEGGRVRTRRGGRGAAVGGGIGGLGLLVVVIISLMTGGDPAQILGGGDGGGGGAVEEGVVGDCTAEQANSDPSCRLSATIQSLDAYWARALPSGVAEPGVEAFTGATSTACGDASAAMGPFYCPPDQTIYLDLGFYDVLQSQYGATGGPLAEMYVTAHEYGHHVQNVTGVMEQADRQGGGAESDSVRIELQADCYAGLWAGHASTTVDPDTGVPFLEPITAEQLAQALSAAAAVGDDHIQSGTASGVDPDTWTHGSSEQRQRWFTTGYEQGSLTACDTFAAPAL